MEFARVNGLSLAYRAEGDAALPTIVFVNSLGTDHRIWDAVVALLGGRFRTLRYDKRGHGLSDTGPVPYRMADHVADLAGLLDHLGVGTAIVCGLSVGGLIAQGLYAARPDLVSALMLCDTAHKIGTDEIWNDRIAAVQKGGIASLADTILERWFTPGFRAPGNAVFAGYRNMLIRSPVEGYVATCAAIRDADFTLEAGKIKVPVLCVVGDQDGSTPPALVKSMADLIPGADYAIIKDAGHLPCIEQPDLFCDHLCNLAVSLAG